MDYVQYIRKPVGHEPVILVAACVAIIDGEGRVLLQHRHDDNTWALPGGIMEFGESTDATARREVFEETGLRVGELELLGVYTDPEVTYPNGDRAQIASLIYWSAEVRGGLNPQEGETQALRYFALDAPPQPLYPHHAVLLEKLKGRLGGS